MYNEFLPSTELKPNDPLSHHGYQHGTLVSTPDPTSNLEQQPINNMLQEQLKHILQQSVFETS